MVNLPYTHACGDPQQIISSKFSVVRLFVDLLITENNDSPENNTLQNVLNLYIILEERDLYYFLI